MSESTNTRSSSDVRREVVLADALDWLPANAPIDGAIFTSLPDSDRTWFVGATYAVFESDADPIVFAQTDRRVGGRTFSKAGTILEAARGSEYPLVWHKIALRRPAGARSFYRPAYTHLLAFSREARSGRPTADVIEAGRATYRDGLSDEATRVVVGWLVAAGAARLVDPFCGRGGFLDVANQAGLDAIGVDDDPDVVALARREA